MESAILPRPEGRGSPCAFKMNEEKGDDSRDELLFAVKAAKQSLPEGTNSNIGEILAFIEGMAPFLDKDTIIRIKCACCDNYAPCFFPVDGDFEVVEPHEYCHNKKVPLHRLSLFTIAKCMEYSKKARDEILDMANAVVEEDLRPALADKKLYDRNFFASYDVDYLIKPKPGMACIEFGHSDDGRFVENGIKICILRRLDPGFGEQTSSIKAVQKYGRTTMVVMTGRQIRRQMGIDQIFEKIAKERDMDIVHL